MIENQKIVKLDKELDEKYGSQIEYMGNCDLDSMELSDGNRCFIENDNFYISINNEPLFSQDEIEADFEMALDMLEFGLNNGEKEDFDLLAEFKNSEYESSKRLGRI